MVPAVLRVYRHYDGIDFACVVVVVSAPWLHIIGIGEDGMDSLCAAARALVEKAEVIIGGDRHQNLAINPGAQRLAWPSPFDAMIDVMQAQKGKRVVVLVTGDPLWYSVGARILKSIPPQEVTFFPQLSAFQLASVRLGWSLADVETLTIHGRPAEQIIPCFAPSARLIVLTKDKSSPLSVAKLLTDRGYGQSKMTVLAAMGGEREARFDGIAQNWSQDVPDFHVLAVECILDADASYMPAGPGLPDDAFEHDGKMTKQDVRAITLTKLAPRRHGLLWDVGLGCGSVAIEWLRLARDGAAIGFEPQAKRRALSERNAVALGVPRLKIIDGKAPDALKGQAVPDAIFIGGGLSVETAEICLTALKLHGRLVANAVTLESEAILLELHSKHGGELTRIQIAKARPVGLFHGWEASMPVTQWHYIKTGDAA